MIRYTVRTRPGLLRFTVRFVVFWGLALAAWWWVEDHLVTLLAAGLVGGLLALALGAALLLDDGARGDDRLARDRDRESVGPVHNPRL